MSNKSGAKKMVRPWKAEIMMGRRKVAEARQAERDKLSPQQQLDRLDRKLGVGIGAKKERARLQKMIAGGSK